MPYWLIASEFVLAPVSPGHTLPRGNMGVGGLGDSRRIWFCLKLLAVSTTSPLDEVADTRCLLMILLSSILVRRKTKSQSKKLHTKHTQHTHTQH